jgi:HTH-type transcriptional regulator / antitoxin HigA
MDMTETFDTAVPPPGFFIREELDARGWSQRDLAFILGVPEQAVTLLVGGKRGISADMARALGDAFDVPADFFANLQKAYELSLARAPDPGVAKRANLQNAYPVREMIKRGWLADTDATMLEAQLMRFFGAANVNEIPHLAHAAKKTRYDEVSPVQLAWLFRVRQIAKSMTVTRYNKAALETALTRFRNFLIDPEEIRHVPRLLSEAGVRFVVVETLPTSQIDGVCFWLNEHSPVIGMSLRHDRIDNYWFVLRHEIEHILLGHGKDAEIVDTDLGADGGASSTSEEERLANAAAANFCVPAEDMNSFIARKSPFISEKDVLGFAKVRQVHPGLVVGQVQKRLDRYDFLRKYLTKVRPYATAGAVVDGWGELAPVAL